MTSTHRQAAIEAGIAVHVVRLQSGIDDMLKRMKTLEERIRDLDARLLVLEPTSAVPERFTSLANSITWPFESVCNWHRNSEWFRSFVDTSGTFVSRNYEQGLQNGYVFDDPVMMENKTLFLQADDAGEHDPSLYNFVFEIASWTDELIKGYKESELADATQMKSIPQLYVARIGRQRTHEEQEAYKAALGLASRVVLFRTPYTSRGYASAMLAMVHLAHGRHFHVVLKDSEDHQPKPTQFDAHKRNTNRVGDMVQMTDRARQAELIPFVDHLLGAYGKYYSKTFPQEPQPITHGMSAFARKVSDYTHSMRNSPAMATPIDAGVVSGWLRSYMRSENTSFPQSAKGDACNLALALFVVTLELRMKSTLEFIAPSVRAACCRIVRDADALLATYTPQEDLMGFVSHAQELTCAFRDAVNASPLLQQWLSSVRNA